MRWGLPEVGQYGSLVFFVPALILIMVLVGGFIAYTLVGRYLYERRRARLAKERLRMEEVFRRLAEESPSEETREILKSALDDASPTGKVDLVRMIGGMDEPKRSLYLDHVKRYEGWISLEKRALRSPFKWKRIEAIEILAELDLPEVFDVLSRCVQEEDEDIVYATTRALARKEDLRAAGILLDLFGTDRVDPKRLVAMLEDFPMPIHELLWPRLKDPEPAERVWAATLLEVSEEPGTVPRLIEAATDPDPDTRSASIRSLSNIGDPRAVEVLPEAFDDEVWFVRASAARLAGALRATDFYERLVDLLRDRTWWVRQNAKTALIALCPDVEKQLVPYLAWGGPQERFLRNMVAEVLDASGAVERKAADLERNPDEEEARRFFQNLIVAEGRGSIEGLARRASPELREVLRELLDASTAREAS